MKKCFSLLFSSLLFIIGIFSACEVGLGAAVDTEAPQIDFAENTISSGAVVRDAFAVFGTWEDDGSIGSVTATLASLSGSGFSVEKEGTFDDEKLSWQVVFDPAEDIIPDGSYELVIIIKDTAEHESRISRAITIDNTPPLVVLSRPSTKSTSSSIDSYGQKFTLEGKAADDNDVSLIEVKVYSNPECTGEPLKTITLPNVPLTIESDVATYSKDTPNDYSVIYGHVDASGIAIKDGTSATRYCQLVVYDGAKRYPADGSAQTDSDLKGNSIEYYYLNSDLAELFTDGYKITELYHILNGTYTGSSEAARAISTSSVLDKLKNEANQVKTGKFKINPENSPQFVVSSRNPLPETGMDFSESTITNGNSYLEIEITPGLDGHLIREETVGVYLIRCNNNGALLKADGTPAANENEAKKIWLIETDKHEQQADISMSGSTYKFKTKSQLGTEAFADMVIGENYFIRVVGKDIQGNDILSEGQYGFQLITSGLNIEVGITVSPAWISTNPNANAANKTVNVTLEYPTENKPFDIYRSSNPDALESSSPIATALNGSPYTDSFAVNDTTLPIDSASAAMPTSTVYYIVKGANAAQSNPKNAIFKYDNCPPQVAVTSVPDVLATEQSTLTFQGTATDWFSASNHTELSGVKKVYVQVYDSAVPANSTPAAGEQNAITASLSDGGWICQIRPADWQGANGAFTARGNKTVKVTVVDGVGLTAEATGTFVYDTASPTVSLNNNWYQFATAAGGQITDENVITGSSVTLPSVVGKVIKLSGTAGDDYGLQSIIIEQKKLGGETVRFEMPASASASTNFVTPHLPLKSTGILVTGSTDIYQGSEFSAAEIGNPSTVDGTYTYIIIAKDVTGKEIKSEQKTITLYTAAPTVTITNPAENEWQTLNNVTISGTALSQEAIAGVFYKFSATQPSLPENPAEASSWTGAGWTSAAGTNSWTKTMNMNDATANSYVLWVGVVDNAGNAALSNSRVINVDASAPVLTANYYQKDLGSLLAANGSVYVKNGTQITLYGNYEDVHSGVKNLTFKLGDDSITPAVTYSTDVITSTVNIPTNYAAYDSSYSTAYKSWKAVFSPTAEGRLTAEGENYAGLKTPVTILDIAVDNIAPVVTISAPSDNAKIAYNNFTISGTANDGTGSGLSGENLKVYYTKSSELAASLSGTTPALIVSRSDVSSDWVELGTAASGATWNFTLSEFSGAIAPNDENTDFYFTVSAKDNAGTGNIGYASPVKVTVDRKKPILSQGSAASTQWYNTRTIHLEGSYSDPATVTATGSATGSGVNEIKYTVNNDSEQQIPTTDGTYNTNITIPGTASSADIKIWAKDAVGNLITPTDPGYQSFTVRVDDTAPVLSADYYTKDNDTSLLTASGNAYIKAGTVITLYGNYKDEESGVSGLTFKLGDNTLTPDTDSLKYSDTPIDTPISGTSLPTNFEVYNPEKSVNYRSWTAKFTATASSTGNLVVEGANIAQTPKTITAVSLTLDTTPPEVIISTPAANAKVGAASLTISGTANDGTGAGLSSEPIKLYYRTTAPATDANGNYTAPASSADWTELDNTTAGSTWSYKTTLLDSVTPNNKNTAIWFMASAKDNAGSGNTGYSVPRKITVDRVNPVYDSSQASIGGKTHAQMIASPAPWHTESTLTITGSFTDTNGSGVDKIIVQRDSAPSVEIPTTNGSFTTNISGFTTDSTLTIKAVDKVGLESTPQTYTVKVDSSAPLVTASHYKKGSGNVQEAGGIIYAKSGTQITLYGNYKDEESGVSALKLFKNYDDKTNRTEIPAATGTTAGVTFTYSTSPTEITADGTPQGDYGTYDENSASAYRSWKAVFSTSANVSGNLTVEGTNVAGLSSHVSACNITIDDVAPVIDSNNIRLKQIDATGTTDAYFKSSKYYINNKAAGKTFKITGVVSDNNYVVESLSISVTNSTGAPLNISPISDASGTFEFTLNGISAWDENDEASAVITATDKAGNVTTTTPLSILFDSTPPEAMHWADAKGKDIYFRIGKADNDKIADGTLWKWETGDSVGSSNDVRNQEVGGKYSNGSWGNSNKIDISGNFYENASGSGLKTIHYAILNNPPSEEQINTLISGGSLTPGSNHVVAVGTIDPLATPELKNVPYNKDTSGHKAAKLVESNFKKTNLSGFNSDNNYLILVAEDNAGNRAADELKVTQKTGTDGTNSAADNSPDYTDADHTNTWNKSNRYYSIKKDTDAPSITSSQTETIYTDGNAAADAISVGGTVSDGTGAGVDRVTLTIPGISNFSHTITSSEISDGNWSYNIPASTFSSSADGTSYQIKATAKDLAGEGNLSEITARTVFVDKKGPVITISTPAQTAKVGATNFAISGNANDGNGAGLSTATGSMKLYYTTNDTLGSATTAPQSITAGTAPASSWVELTDGAITVNADNTWQSSSTSPYSLTSISTPNENTNLYFIVSAKDSSGTGNTGYSIPRKITVDRKTPVFVSGTAGGSSNAETWLNTRTINISGSYTDPATGSGANAIAGSGVSTIKYQVGSTAIQSLPTSDGSYDKTISLANSVTQETIKVWAVDAAGNEIPATDTTNRKSYTIKIDTAAPSLTANYYRRGSDTSVPLAASSGTIYMKSQTGGTSFTLYGNYTDSTGGSGIKQLKIKKDGVEIPAANLTSLLYSEEEITGTNGTVPADSTYGTYSAASATSYKSWKAVFTVTEGGRITVEGEDIAGNTVSASALDITIDDTPPEVSNVKLNVTTVTGSSEVTNEVYSATVTDSVSGTTTKTYYLNNTVSGKTFTVTGLATDNVGLQSAVLNIVNTATSPAIALTRTASNPNGSLSFTVGNWSGWTTGATATITLTDKAGNTATSEALNISFDTVAPLVDSTKLKTPTAIQTESSLFKFEGEAACVHPTETDTVFSGYDKVDILFTTSASAPAANAAAQATANVATNGSGSGSWSSTVEFGNTDTFGNVFVSSNGTAIEGTKYLWVRAYDNAGNVGGWVSKDFVYDTKTPSISFTPTAANKNPAADSYRNSGFKLEVDASDTYGIASGGVTLSYEGLSTPIELTQNTDGKYEKEFVVGSTNTSASNYLADGSYSFTITVKDLSGKTSSVTRSFSIDTTAPVIDMTNTSVTRGADYTASNIGWHKTNQIPVSVSVSDSGAGIGAVQVSTDTGFTNPTNLMQSESGSWTGTIVCGAQGANTIYIKATDAVGNATNVVTANSLTVYIDTTPPADPIFLGISTGTGDSLTATPASQIASVLVNTVPERAAPVTVYAALVDDSTAGASTFTGIPAASTAAALKQKGKEGTSTYIDSSAGLPSAISTALPDDVTSDYKFWSYEIATADMRSGGVNFTVKDNAGNEADYVLFQMTVDNTAPTATFNPISNLNLERTSDDTTTYVNGTITLSGTANDNQKLDSVKVEYKKQGATTWTEIPAPANDSLASWTRTLDTTTLEDETEYDIRVSATDSAGNSTDNSATSTTVAARTQTVKVSQDTDRPIIKFTNLSLPATMSATGRLSFRNEELYGNITDDDGVPLSLSYYYGTGTPADSDWKTTPNLSYSSGSFTLKFKDANDRNDDGPHHLYFKVTDASGTSGKVFTSKDVISSATTMPAIPKIIDNSTSNKYGYITRSGTGTAADPVTYSSSTTVTYLTVDTTDPYRGNLKFSTNYSATTPTWQEKTDITAIPFGGNRNSFKIKIPAWDVNGVTITMTIEGYTGSITFKKTTESAGDAIYTEAKYWESSVITIPSTMETGVKACNIDVFDGVRHNKDDFSISVDNTAPVINATSPSSTQYSSGNVIAYGETDLTYWKNTASTDHPREFMYYALSLDNTTTPAESYEDRNSATAIKGWKDENDADGQRIKTDDNGYVINETTNEPELETAVISYKPYYTPILGGGYNWYVYFDGSSSTASETHDATFRSFLVNSGVTTQALLDTTDQSLKFRTKVKAYLWIKAVDQVGNKTEIKHPILIDPQGDAPSVSIDYPEASGTTLGGAITLRGSANDTKGANPGVESVWVQIISSINNEYDSSATASQTTGTRIAGGLKFEDTVTSTGSGSNITYKHSYTLNSFAPQIKDVRQWLLNGYQVYKDITTIDNAATTNVTEGPEHVTSIDESIDGNTNGAAYYIRANFSGSAWNLKINEHAEFDPGTGKLNPIAYRVFAKDNDGNLSSYEQQLSVYDSDNPVISNVYLRQYSNNTEGTGTVTASRAYEDDMWVRGTWWLCGTVKDTQGLSKLEVGPSGAKVNQSPAGTANTDEPFKYKLNSGSGVGQLTIIIEAADIANAGQNPHTTTKECAINYDNTPPELLGSTAASFNISSAVQNSNGFYTFGSQVMENPVNNAAQSGFDYLAFWFERDLTTETNPNAKHVVYDVMRPKTQINGATVVNTSEVDWTDLATTLSESEARGLKWKSNTVTRNQSQLGHLTMAGTDANIHVGGLCMLKGSVYMITSVETTGTGSSATTTIGINGQPEYEASQTAYFAIANVVNNTVEAGSGAKSTADGMYGYYTQMSNDDGDHMIESVSKQGTTWDWEANINSQNIADGSIVIHYVAFDKAGNFITGQVNGNVANNAPRLASLEVWSDFNENGTKDAGEFDTRWVNGRERKINDTYGTRSTAVTDELIVSGNNKDYTDGGSAFMTVKATTRFIPELVGGNGALYYTYKYGTASTLATNTPSIGASSIGIGSDDGIDEDIDNSGYYVEDQNQSGYISGRTDLYPAGTEANAKHYMEIPGAGATGTYSLNGIGNSSAESGPTWFEYTIYDSTEGSTAWSTTSLNAANRLSAKFRVALNLKYQDTTRPVVKIRPFYWNSLTENSVDKPANPASFADLRGHIELEGDLPTSFTAEGSGINDRDPKVSGVIRIEGYAFDDIKLKELYVQMSNHTNLKGSGSNGVKVASYNGSWTTTSHAADAGWDFTAADVYCNGDGHLVRWTLTVDTAKRASPAEPEQTVVVYAVDARGSSDTNTSVHDGSTQTALSTYRWGDVKTQENASSTYFKDFWCYRNVDNDITDSAIVYREADKASMTYYYKMDIVPYVTKVETGLSRYKNSNWSVYNRTALGHYPVQSVVTNVESGILKTTTSENVTLYGFNLNHSSATFTSGSSTFKTDATENLKITNSTDTTDTTTKLDKLAFNVANLQTGKLNLTVNGIPLMNNSNNNDAKGTANEAGNSNANYYNLQPNGDTNNIQNDDVEFDVWEFNDRAAVPINGLATGINMEVNQKTGMLNYAFANGGLYYSMGGNTDKTRSYKNDSYSSIYWAGDWDTFAGPCVGFHVDDQGYTYSVVTGGDTNKDGHVDKYAFYTSRWGKGTLGTGGTYGGGNSLRLEHIALKTGNTTFDYSLMKYRFLSSEFASTVNDNDTNLYMVYYDALTNQIRFRAGTFSGTAKQSVGGFQDEATGNTPSWYATANCQIIANGESDPFKINGNANNNTTTVPVIDNRGAGQYVDVAVVKVNGKDVVCVVWFDSITNSCKFSYITDPITNWDILKDDATAKNWSTPVTVFEEGGEYCHIVADKNNHLHIAAYAGNGDVKYAYLASPTSTPSTCTVDASGAVGEHLTLDVAVSSNGNSIPYIGYYTSAIKMPKYAYLVDKTEGFSQTAAGVDAYERFTGNWEVAVVPSPSRMTTNREDKVNVGVWKNAGVLTDSKINGSVMNSSHSAVGSTGYSATNWSKTFGNGTSNAVLGYQISTSTGSCLETAQKR